MFNAVGSLANSIDAEIDAIDRDRETEYRLHHNRLDASAPATPARTIALSLTTGTRSSATRERASALVQSSHHSTNLTRNMSANGDRSFAGAYPQRSLSSGSAASPPPRHHYSSTSDDDAQPSAMLQRERVESILRGFSVHRGVSSQPSERRTASTASATRSQQQRYDTTLPINASAHPTSSFAPPSAHPQHRSIDHEVRTVAVPRGTIDQSLITESQNEVVTLRDALLKATEALHRTQTELRNEQYRCTQFLDDIARQQREGEANRLEISQLKFDLDASRRAEQRNSETQQETIHHLNRLVDQQVQQIRELMLSQETWQKKCDVKDDDIAKVLSALQKSANEQLELRTCLDAAEKEHQRLLRFIDGPLASFAKDAQTLRTTWNNLEVTTDGDISLHRRDARTLQEHKSLQRRQQHKLVAGRNEQFSSPASGRKLVEKLITQHNLERSRGNCGTCDR